METISFLRFKSLHLLTEIASYHVDIQLKQLEDAIECYKRSGFNPNQPRVPAGNPDGGQWTDGGVGSLKPNSEFSLISDAVSDIMPKPVLKLVRRHIGLQGEGVNRANIFVGGLGDQSSNNNVLGSNSLNKTTYGDNYYAPYDNKDKINAQIAQLPKNQTINLIGHSYGGDTAAWAAVHNPGKVHTLITIDPVSYDKPNFAKVKDSVTVWVNINSAGNPNRPLDDISWGNIIAGIGKSWDNTPNGYATYFYSAPYDHVEFENMMNYSPKRGTLPSAQALLNQSKKQSHGIY